MARPLSFGTQGLGMFFSPKSSNVMDAINSYNSLDGCYYPPPPRALKSNHVRATVSSDPQGNIPKVTVLLPS